MQSEQQHAHGHGHGHGQPAGHTPFTVSIPDAELDELRRRLQQTRWADAVEDAGWAYGAEPAFMREVVRSWLEEFDWRAAEARMNAFDHFRADLNGVGVHYIHARGVGPQPLPLLITHGWPSSFVEMLDLIPRLTDPARFGGDPADAFDVVVPSIPGYGFSDRPTRSGFSYREIADLWLQLMAELGYGRFAGHSYDVGGTIMGLVCRRHPQQVIGYHTTEAGNPAPRLDDPAAPPLSAAEAAYRAYAQRWQADEGGYMALQTTRPQSLGFALNDSPVGTAAWILEKWQAWTEPQGGDLRASFTMDQLLTNVTLYWLTQTLNSANRLYYERAHNPTPLEPGETIGVPYGVTMTTQGIEQVPREYIERVYTNLQRYERFERGGHFVALEQPDALAAAIRAFFRPLREAAQG